LGSAGYQVPPGISDATVPNPIFNLTPAATVDEGNNWINISWGPLALTHPVTGATLGNYALAAGSPAIDYIGSSATTYDAAPSTDFFGNPRKTLANPCVDVGAVDISAGPTCGGSSPSASVTGSGDFGNWAAGTTSNVHTFTVTNTGGVALAGGTFTFGGGTPQPFTRATLAQGGGGTCGVTLAVGASCTFNVVFTPASATSFSRTLTVAYTSATVTGSPVTLTGTGVANRATVSITPNPLTIVLASGQGNGTGTVTLTNTAPSGSAQVAVSNVTVLGGLFIDYFFSAVSGQDNCTGAVLAPGGNCTVGVRFTNVFAARNGSNRTGTIRFTDNAAGSPQSGSLIGQAN
jgi:hypothetical protein